MPYRNAAGQFYDGRANDAKSKSLNKDQHFLPYKHQQQADHGPPSKKRRIDTSPAPTVSGTTSFSKGPLRISFTKLKSTTAHQPVANGIHKQSPIEAEALRGDMTSSDKYDSVAQTGGQQEQGKEQSDKRILRSQDPGAHGTSELAQFFADYWDVINGPEEEPDPLNVDAIFYLDDDKPEKDGQAIPDRSRQLSTARSQSSITSPSTKRPIQPLTSKYSIGSSTTLRPTGPASFRILDLSQFEAEAMQFNVDPLADAEYLPAHKRGEKGEKQTRNQDKERNKHDKVLLEKLKEELSGPEWHKAMGLSGITESDHQKFESKRRLYYRKVKEMLAQFADWKEKEKNERERKERAAARAARAAEQDEGADEETEISYIASLDASALQLQQEAGLRRPETAFKIKLRMPARNTEEVTSGPFTSFFAKAHERAGALAGHRRGRHVLAFGHSLPDMAEHLDFDLPEEDFDYEKEQHRKSAHARRK